MGGMGGVDGGTHCAQAGCSDGNDCTVDGSCSLFTGMCTGGGNEPLDTPCNHDGGFFCDGEGSCVACNEDAQCAPFFVEDCREPPTCENNTCAISDRLPDGAPCSVGECQQGECVTIEKLVPMVCDNTVTPFFWEIPMKMSVRPLEAIQATRDFEADTLATLSVPREFLQEGLIAVFPTELTSLQIVTAAAEIVTEGVLSGSPVSTIETPIPFTVPIPQAPNPGDPGGSACATNAECPLAAFFQTCNVGGACDCACQPGCVPAECANIATDDVPVPVNPIFKAPYLAAESGEVCFDVGGEDPPSAIGAPPVRTGIRAVASNGAFVRFECVGGTVNDNGTPDLPADDFVDPNPPSSQICFPIQTPDVDFCEGPPVVDCPSANQCVVADVCDPFTGQCVGGIYEPAGTPCDQNGGNSCDGDGTCIDVGD
jgi:hypothetical protein